MFIKDHLREVHELSLYKPCGRTASQDLAEFILSSASLRTMEICKHMHAVFYSMLADKAQQCKIQNLMIQCVDLDDQPLSSRDLAEFICQMPHLKSLKLYHTKLHKDFFSKWASIVSSAKGNNRSTPPHTSLRELRADVNMVIELQLCGDMFDGVQKLFFSSLLYYEFDSLQRVHGFQGVTELTIGDGFILQPYPFIGKPSTMIRHLVRVFPQLVKLTFRIKDGNAIFKQILESLRETRGLPLKSGRVATHYSQSSDELMTMVDCEEVRERQIDEEPGEDSDYETYSWMNMDVDAMTL
eukprot:XP_011678347.1 PREDICTED: uncharacterized protein LOC105445036 [Strongylocentrotus purpuratus]